MVDPVARVLRRVFIGVLIFCTAIFLWGAVKTFHDSPPIPSKVVTTNGQVVFTSGQVFTGKAAFQEADLMDYGSVYGNGSYFGEDYTALLLHELAIRMNDLYAQTEYHIPASQLAVGQKDTIQSQVQNELRHSNVVNGVLTVSPVEGEAMTSVIQTTANSLMHTDPKTGYSYSPVLTNDKAVQVSKFFMYTAWTSVAQRPGATSSYTNNWPYEPLVGNQPTTQTFTWTWASIGFLIVGIGITLFLYYTYITSPVEEEAGVATLKGFPPLTESQRKTGKYFISVAIFFLLQIGAGIIMAHYYSDRASFFGINLLNILPFNALRSMHIQLAIFWVAISWIGAGIFLAPFVSGKEPKHQGLLVDILFVALWIVGLASLFGMYAGIKGWLPGNSWFWFGNQGLAYLELGRVDQIALFIGLCVWAFIVGRALWPALRKQKGFGSLEYLLFYSSISIAVLYLFGMFPMNWIMQSFTLTDFWRWWVVHLWVEASFEFFAVVVSAYLLVVLGLLSRKVAERATLFELILVFLGGIIGTGHHMYWVGEPGIWIGLGSMFSFIEILPLLLLVIESVQNWRHMHNAKHFEQRTAVLYIVGSGLWNFLGAGALGVLINTPLMNYYEHGTFLTLGHAHTAMFGVFGLLGIGLIYFALRYFVGEEDWTDGPATWAFWMYNIGMILWLALNFFPVGFNQLIAVYTHSYEYARSIDFYNTQIFWQWMRLPGDIFFVVGAFLNSWDILQKVRILYNRRRQTNERTDLHM
jgi:nitric oxide reductase subunit B